MHISLRSPLIAGTAAVGCAAAVAVIPLAPNGSLPALSSANTAVALSAMNSPITALMDTSALALNYLFTSTYSSDPVTNWGTASGIGLEWNALLPLQHDDTLGFLPHITAVGIVPNFIEVPFPIATQMVNNWIGYAQLLFQPGGLATIASDVAAKTSAVVRAVTELVPLMIRTMGYQMELLTASVTGAVTAITAALVSGNLEGAWNAAVDGLLSPSGIPGTLLNLTIGAGIQTDPTDPATFVPSSRYMLQTAGQELASALQTTAEPPTSASSAVAPRSAAVKAAAATSATAPVAVASVADTGGAPSATAGPDSTSKATAKPAGRRAAAAARAAAR